MSSSMLRFVIFLALTVQCVVSDCNRGWVEYNGYCYSFSNEALNWFLAAGTCNLYGGRLVQIQSQTKHDWIVSQMEEHNFAEIWTGGSKRLSGFWEWIPSFESFKLYSNWASGEPNNPKSELCVTIRSDLDYKWNDATCSLFFRYICEKRAKSNEKPWL